MHYRFTHRNVDIISRINLVTQRVVKRASVNVLEINTECYVTDSQGPGIVFQSEHRRFSVSLTTVCWFDE